MFVIYLAYKPECEARYFIFGNKKGFTTFPSWRKTACEKRNVCVKRTYRFPFIQYKRTV